MSTPKLIEVFLPPVRARPSLGILFVLSIVRTVTSFTIEGCAVKRMPPAVWGFVLLRLLRRWPVRRVFSELVMRFVFHTLAELL